MYKLEMVFDFIIDSSEIIFICSTLENQMKKSYSKVMVNIFIRYCNKVAFGFFNWFLAFQSFFPKNIG